MVTPFATTFSFSTPVDVRKVVTLDKCIPLTLATKLLNVSL